MAPDIDDDETYIHYIATITSYRKDSSINYCYFSSAQCQQSIIIVKNAKHCNKFKQLTLQWAQYFRNVQHTAKWQN